MFGTSLPLYGAVSGSIEVSVVEEYKEAKPGEVITVVFRVHNTYTEPREFEASINLPEGWELVTNLGSFTLPARGQEIKLVSFRVPFQAAAGTYRVRYTARDKLQPASTDFGVIAVRVVEVYGAELQVVGSPRYVRAGSSYATEWMVTNTGNTAATVFFEAINSMETEVFLDSTVVTIPARETYRFSVQARTREDQMSAHLQRIRLEAFVMEDEDVQLSVNSAVTVIPMANQIPVNKPRFPAAVILSGLGNEMSAGGQVQLLGSGAIYGGQLNFNLTLPDHQHVSTFGRRDRTSIRYAREPFSVLMGDHVYTLSPLTTSGRYGFGLGGELTSGDFTYKSYLQRSRYVLPRDVQFGSSVTYAWRPNTTFSANILKRDGLIDGETITLRSTNTLKGAGELDVECGIDSQVGLMDPAYSMRFSGYQSWISYQTHLMHTGIDYPGYTNGLNSRTASVNVRPTRALRLEASWQDRNRAFVGDQTRRYQFLRLGSGLVGSANNRPIQVFLYYLQRSTTLTRTAYIFDRGEKSLQLRAGYSFSRVGLRGVAELGRTQSRALSLGGTFKRFQVQARFSPRAQFMFDTAFEYYSGLFSYSPVKHDRWMAKLNTTVRLTGQSRAMFTLYGGVDQQVVKHRFLHGHVRVEHQFKNGQQVSLRAQFSLYDGMRLRRTTDYILSYTMPISAPLPDNEKMDRRLSGRVFDAETGEGISDVLVYLGESMMLTMPDGTFSMAAAAEGIQYLSLDHLSIRLDRVSLQQLPLAINFDREELPELDIPVVRGARIAGAVVRNEGGVPAVGDIAEADSLVGLKQVVLEIQKDNERYRTVTDGLGRYFFDGVPPGEWNLSVVHAQLPRYHYLENDTQMVNVGPGESVEADFAVLERQRRIQMLDTKTISVNEKKSDNRSQTLMAERVKRIVNNEE